MKLSELLISSRLLYLALTRKMNRNTKLVYYGDEYLMEYTGLSKDGYCAATKELTSKFIIQKVKSGSSKRRIELLLRIDKDGEFYPFDCLSKHELDYKLSLEQYYTDDSYNTVPERASRRWKQQQ